jgi:hypothetical protein
MVSTRMNDLCIEILTKQDIGNEEDRARNIVLIAGQPDILVHAFDLRIADVASIDMAKEVQYTKYADKSEVDL